MLMVLVGSGFKTFPDTHVIEEMNLGAAFVFLLPDVHRISDLMVIGERFKQYAGCVHIRAFEMWGVKKR